MMTDDREPAGGIPIRTDAMSVYDTLSEADKDALRRVDDIRERIIRRLYVRAAGHGGAIDPREVGREAARQGAPACEPTTSCFASSV
jgi:hypothetical protein